MTKVSGVDGKPLDVSINDAFEIRGVLIRTETGEIIFPSYVGKGRIYREVSVVSRDYKKYLFEAIRNRKLSKADGGVNFKVNKLKIIRNHKTVAAFASVIFEDKLEAECRIMKGKHGLWIAWPSVKKDEKWKKQFVFLDEDLKYSVENALIEKYKKKIDEQQKIR